MLQYSGFVGTLPNTEKKYYILDIAMDGVIVTKEALKKKTVRVRYSRDDKTGQKRVIIEGEAERSSDPYLNVELQGTNTLPLGTVHHDIILPTDVDISKHPKWKITENRFFRLIFNYDNAVGGDLSGMDECTTFP
eukprot:m.66267 g.66267  ORF g.66267 m.66267 type:complete len:135 (+) comp15933_c2_seq1:195-599(+)